MVETEPSWIAIGAMLTQKGRPLPSSSKALAHIQQALFIYDEGMFVILFAVNHWNSY